MTQQPRPRKRTRSDKNRPKNPREIALRVLYHVDTRKAFSDLLLNQAFREAGSEPRDAALATELVGGTLRWRARLDWILDRYATTELDQLPPWIRNVLRLGLYQMLYLDRIPVHSAVDESVKLARKYGHSGTAGFTNAVLRKILHDINTLPDPEAVIADPPEAIAVAYSHPQWLVERWVRRLGLEEAKRLLAANNLPTPLGLRVNPLRTDRETLRRALADQGIDVEAAPHSKLSLRVRGNLVPHRVPEFDRGHFFVQDESETLVTELLAPEPGETILDLCAAPGGKTTQIQESRGSRGPVLAVDSQPSRLSRIQDNLLRLGLENVDTLCADGRTFSLTRTVDRVLVDAPCSGLGVLGRRADARWRKTEASMRALLPLEQELLQAGSTHVRPGGVLVFSVCSTEPEETTGQISRFLDQNPDFVLEDASGFVTAEVVTDGHLLLYPHRHGTDGAFAARLRRQG